MWKIKDNIFSGLGIACILFLFIVGCSRVPKGIIPEKKMQQLLYDMHLADAIINTDFYTFHRYEDRNALYQSIFEKHKVTEALYDSSLVWYGKHLDIYMQVYNMALTEVKMQIEEIGEIVSDMVLTGNEDIVDIWPNSRHHEFYLSSLSNNLIFDIMPEEDFSSGSIFVLSLQVLGLVSDIQSPIDVHLRAEQHDTTIIVNNAIRKDGFYEIVLKTLPIEKAKKVYGYIRLNEETVPYHKIYLNDIRLQKYRYGSEVAGRLDSVSINN